MAGMETRSTLILISAIGAIAAISTVAFAGWAFGLVVFVIVIAALCILLLRAAKRTMAETNTSRHSIWHLGLGESRSAILGRQIVPQDRHTLDETEPFAEPVATAEQTKANSSL